MQPVDHIHKPKQHTRITKHPLGGSWDLVNKVIRTLNGAISFISIDTLFIPIVTKSHDCLSTPVYTEHHPVEVYDNIPEGDEAKCLSVRSLFLRVPHVEDHEA